LVTPCGILAVLKRDGAWPELGSLRDIGISAGGFGLVGAILADLP
jgi:hypothetical protein